MHAGYVGGGQEKNDGLRAEDGCDVLMYGNEGHDRRKKKGDAGKDDGLLREQDGADVGLFQEYRLNIRSGVLCGKAVRAGYALFKGPVMVTGPLLGKTSDGNISEASLCRPGLGSVVYPSQHPDLHNGDRFRKKETRRQLPLLPTIL
jgi:hypothetical protein